MRSQDETILNIKRNSLIFYRVLFPAQDPLPKVKTIMKNGHIICRGSKDLVGLSIKYENKLMLHKTTNDNTCGRVTIGIVSSLIIKGEQVKRGQFPWLGALFISSKGKLGFACGTSLISSRLNILSAHCVKFKNENVLPKNVQIFFDKFNLDDWTDDRHVRRGASHILVHHKWNYNSERIENDIAIIVMDHPVEFTDYVKPICVWPVNQENFHITGLVGVTAGWCV